MMQTTANFHLGLSDSIRSNHIGHSDNSRSLTIEAEVGYGGFTVFCTADQARALASAFTRFADSFATSAEASMPEPDQPSNFVSSEAKL